MNVAIYTDGACSGNPGIGGWGVVILLKKNKKPVAYPQGSHYNKSKRKINQNNK